MQAEETHMQKKEQMGQGTIQKINLTLKRI